MPKCPRRNKNSSTDANGDIWRNQRKVAANIFNVKNFRDLFTRVFIEEAKKLVETMEKAYNLGAAIELQDMLLRATMDSFVMIAMSKNRKILYIDNDVYAVYILDSYAADTIMFCSWCY